MCIIILEDGIWLERNCIKCLCVFLTFSRTKSILSSSGGSSSSVSKSLNSSALTVTRYVGMILDAIFNSADQCPSVLRVVLRQLWIRTAAQFNQPEHYVCVCLYCVLISLSVCLFVFCVNLSVCPFGHLSVCLCVCPYIHVCMCDLVCMSELVCSVSHTYTHAHANAHAATHCFTFHRKFLILL